MPAMKRLPTLLLLLLCALATACGGARTRTPAEDALTAYATALRWSDFDSAVALIDPATRSSPVLAPEERAQLAKVKVTGYEVKSHVLLPDGNLEQTVQIRVVDEDTQKERILLDHQRWRPDPTGKLWLLVSGLPEF
jgi:hypothetical protein